MKRCSLTDRIYYYSYHFIMKTPSKEFPYEAATDWMAMIVFFHLLGVAILMGITRIPKGTVIIIFILAIIILFAGAHYYYAWKKNGERIIKGCSGITGERTSAIIGGLIALEAFVFPIICVIFFGYFISRFRFV